MVYIKIAVSLHKIYPANTGFSIGIMPDRQGMNEYKDIKRPDKSQLLYINYL